jgi:hypothetical protein
MTSEYMWVYSPKPAKLNKALKALLLDKVSYSVRESSKLNAVVNRIEIKAGRVYLYHLSEQYGWDDPSRTFIKPLIDGRYNEYPLARIMIINSDGSKCRLDWQRHNGQWMDLKEGNMEECIKFIEDDDWFSHYFPADL